MNSSIKNLTFTAFCLALALLLPFVTGQIPQFGNMLLPMHLPVLLCGFICGWKNGICIGFIAPLLRYVLFGNPPLIPIGLPMAFELATYGFVSGLLYSFKNKSLNDLYLALTIALIAGRMVWALVRIAMIGLAGVDFGLEIFFTSAIISAIPGILLQLVLIPILVKTLKKN